MSFTLKSKTMHHKSTRYNGKFRNPRPTSVDLILLLIIFYPIIDNAQITVFHPFLPLFLIITSLLCVCIQSNEKHPLCRDKEIRSSFYSYHKMLRPPCFLFQIIWSGKILRIAKYIAHYVIFVSNIIRCPNTSF